MVAKVRVPTASQGAFGAWLYGFPAAEAGLGCRARSVGGPFGGPPPSLALQPNPLVRVCFGRVPGMT